MPEQITKLKVFISSPSDLPENEREIAKQVCESMNRTPLLREIAVMLEPVRWETHVYPDAIQGHPQTELTNLAATSDILIALFNRKLGSAGPNAASGTVGEIEAALMARESAQTKPIILTYFRDGDAEQDDKRFAEVLEYKKGLHKRKVRTEDYKNASSFQNRLYEALQACIFNFYPEKKAFFERNIAELDNGISRIPQPLFNWPQVIDGQWIDRSEFELIFEKINGSSKENKKSSSATLVLGGPGSGKSALLARLGVRLREKGIFVISIKADMISAGISTNENLSKELCLPVNIEDYIQQIALIRPIVLIIDQLDAVSDIADRKSERLNILLDLIKNATFMEGVHVIASSRIFEYRHDVRLATINAEVITLQQIPLEKIENILQKYGIALQSISPEVQEFLATPLHLKLFTEVVLRSEGRLAALKTIYDLYEEIWQQKIQRTSNFLERDALITKLTDYMRDEEELWAPSSIADGFSNALVDLEADGIIIREGIKIGFKHQTLFDFALARNFAKGTKHLADYVIEHQDGLFVRPTLLATLDYLRASSRRRYHAELMRLWDSPNLRKHLVILLDEKICSFCDPDEVEQSLVIPLIRDLDLDSSRTIRLLVSMGGSEGWFELLKAAYLPKLLLSNHKEAWIAMNILTRAWNFAHSSIIVLLQNYFLPRPEKDEYTLAILREIDYWDEQAANLVCTIARRTYSYWVRYLAIDISAVLPELAPRIVSADFERCLESAMKSDKSAPPAPELAEDATMQDRIVHNISFEPNKSLKRLLEHGYEWYDLPKIAEAAPLAFLNALWELFSNSISYLAYEIPPFINQYRDSGIYVSIFEEDRQNLRFGNQLIAAIYTAIITLAKKDAEKFIKFYQENLNSQYLLIHRLLSYGLLDIIESRPEMVLEYLTTDSKRLTIGSHQDRHRESILLIKKVVPHLDSPQRALLEKSILKFNIYLKNSEEWTAKEKQDRFKWNREHRLRLLRAFPREYLSADVKRLHDEEERALPNTQNYDSRSYGGTVVSRMNADQMSKAGETELLSLFNELDDSTTCSHPRRKWGDLVGGVYQAAQVLEKLAEKEPAKVISIVHHFKPQKQEIPTGHAVSGLAKSDLPSNELFSLISYLNASGFASNDFRTSVANALSERSRKDQGLPEDMLIILNEWLQIHPYPKLDHTSSDKEEKTSESVLWRYGGVIMFAGGRANIVEAIAKGYLLHKTEDLSGWTSTISNMLTFENHPNVWQIAFLYMPYLFNGDKIVATDLFDRLFRKCPLVQNSHDGAIGVARILHLVSNIETAKKWLIGIRDSEWINGKQAFGELLVLWCCRYQKDDWAKAFLKEILNSMADIEICRGIAFAASHIWPSDSEEYKRICTEILLKLATSDDEITQKAISSLFRYEESLQFNDSIISIIEAIIRNDSLLLRSAQDLIDTIESATTFEPELAYKVCIRLLEAGITKVNSMGGFLPMLAEPLVRIAMTLHRMPLYRSKGLDLFENLIESNINEARQALQLLDRRPYNNIPPVPNSIRRRRKVKAHR